MSHGCVLAVLRHDKLASSADLRTRTCMCAKFAKTGAQDRRTRACARACILRRAAPEAVMEVFVSPGVLSKRGAPTRAPKKFPIRAAQRAISYLSAR